MITVTFLTNFVLGFILAAEFGQTSIEIFRRGLRHGFDQALLVALGGTLADFLYLNIAITGILLFLNRPEILKALWIVGGIAILTIAIRGIRDAQKTGITPKNTDTNPLVAGFLLNFVHPINLIYWVTILSSILVKDIRETTFLTAYVDGMGIPLGVFGWWLFLSAFASLGRRWATPKLLQQISIGSSLLLLGFALWFFYNAFIL